MRAQGPNALVCIYKIIPNVVITNHKNNTNLLFFELNQCRTQESNPRSHMKTKREATALPTFPLELYFLWQSLILLGSNQIFCQPNISKLMKYVDPSEIIYRQRKTAD